MRFLLLSGSFRANSRSLLLLSAASDHLNTHSCRLPRLGLLPFFCEDLNANKPVEVRDFLDEVQAADGIICCTPEYNHSIPAVLKNALDWASRPAFESPLKDKPVSIITQAVSPVGGARAQAHLKLVLDSTLADIHICHEMMISGVDKRLAEGGISDPNTQRRLERHLDDFLGFIALRQRPRG